MNEKILKYFNGDELAASVWKSKYQQEGDETPDDMHKRMAEEFARIEAKYQEEEKDKDLTSLSKYGRKRKSIGKQEIYDLFKNFKYIIPQGSVMATLGTDKISSLSNCFFNGYMEDSIDSIFDTTKSMAQIGKMRGGTSTDLSHLRPKGATVDNSAKESAGATTFLSLIDTTGKIIGQKGRKMAMMITMDINHPDVLDFIKIKKDLSKVTNANLSVKLSDEFMQAVKNDEDYILMFPVNLKHPVPEFVKNNDRVKYNTLYPIEMSPTVAEKNPNLPKVSYFKKIKAREYWNEIIKSAHSVAEPGLLFWGGVLEYSPDSVYEQYKPEGCNPCSEITLSKLDSCRLMVVNLFSFVKNPFTKEAYFDFKKFCEVNYEAMRLSDDLVDLELEYVQKIIDKAEKSGIQNEVELWKEVYRIGKAGRRTGLGFTALGDTLAALGLKYDSPKAMETVGMIMFYKMKFELDCTIDLAILRGSFEGADSNLEFDTSGTEFVARGRNSFYQALVNWFPEQVERMLTYNRRNISWSTVAPTGTVSIMTQTTSGIEPLFQPFYVRRKKVDIHDINSRVDFTDDNGDTWQEFTVLHPKFKQWLKITYEANDERINNSSIEELNILFKDSPWYQSTANDIDWIKRVGMQSLIQKYITHSISSTINLPKNVSEEEVSKIYLESWEQCLKGITVYRDGSRSGVLVNTKSNERNSSNFNHHDSPKRPKKLEADYYFTTSGGRKYAVIIGLIDNKPYELFAFENPLEEKNMHGVIIKIKRGVYKFNSNKYTIENLQLSSDHSDEKLLTRWISLALRHGAHPKYLVEQTEKSELEVTAFAKVVARVLKKYIVNNEKVTSSVCPECQSDSMIYQEGCKTCSNCGYTACS